MGRRYGPPDTRLGCPASSVVKANAPSPTRLLLLLLELQLSCVGGQSTYSHTQESSVRLLTSRKRSDSRTKSLMSTGSVPDDSVGVVSRLVRDCRDLSSVFRIAVMRAFALVIFLVFFGVSADALDCQKELDSVENCMGEQLQQIIPNTPTNSLEKLKDDIKQCFADAGCHNPVDKKELDAKMSEVPPELLKRLEALQQGFGGLQQMNKQALEAAKTCGLKMKEQLQPKLLACVRKHKGFENIEWPEGLDEEVKENDQSPAARFMRFVVARGDRLFKQKQHLAEVARLVYDDKVCVTDEAREKAKKCISKAVDGTVPSEMKCLNAIDQEFLIMDKRDRICTVHKECMAKLPSECVKVVADMPKVTCQCSAEIVDSDFVQLIDTMQSCMENRSGESLGAIRNPIFTTMLKSVSSQAMKQVCAQLEDGLFDPCKSLTLSDFDHFGDGSQVQVQHIQIQQISLPAQQQFAFPGQQQFAFPGQQQVSFSGQQLPSFAGQPVSFPAGVVFPASNKK
uniref:Uncharacterized protein n=1 Tax=Plectus sambesii TaxID=2011161 RepID=A0A914WIQ8_9BILA